METTLDEVLQAILVPVKVELEEIARLEEAARQAAVAEAQLRAYWVREE